MVSAHTAGVRTLAMLFALSLFLMRCLGGYISYQATFCGTCDAVIRTMSEDDIIAAINRDLWTMLIRPKAPPRKLLGVKVWPRVKPTPV
jgi:hypothetical protein